MSTVTFVSDVEVPQTASGLSRCRTTLSENTRAGVISAQADRIRARSRQQVRNPWPYRNPILIGFIRACISAWKRFNPGNASVPGHRSRALRCCYLARAEATTSDGHADDSFPSLVRSPCRPQGNPPRPRLLSAVISKPPRPSGQAQSRPGSDSSNTALFRWCRARQRPGESAASPS